MQNHLLVDAALTILAFSGLRREDTGDVYYVISFENFFL